MKRLLQKLFAPLSPVKEPEMPPQVPPGLTVYAIGDIHGERQCLEQLVDGIIRDVRSRHGQNGGRAEVVFLGDYIDRGPDSRGVLEFLQSLPPAGDGVPGWTFLRGNHEEAMLEFLQRPAPGWLSFGGLETLASYGVPASAGIARPERLASWRQQLDQALPAHHLDFLHRLKDMVIIGDYAFVHAGISPGVPLERQQPADLLWIREPFLSSSRWHGKKIVHGHTVTARPEVCRNRIGIDTGACDSGCLTAVVLQGEDVSFLQTSP